MKLYQIIDIIMDPVNNLWDTDQLKHTTSTLESIMSEDVVILAQQRMGPCWSAEF